MGHHRIPGFATRSPSVPLKMAWRTQQSAGHSFHCLSTAPASVPSPPARSLASWTQNKQQQKLLTSDATLQESPHERDTDHRFNPPNALHSASKPHSSASASRSSRI